MWQTWTCKNIKTLVHRVSNLTFELLYIIFALDLSKMDDRLLIGNRQMITLMQIVLLLAYSKLLTCNMKVNLINLHLTTITSDCAISECSPNSAEFKCVNNKKLMVQNGELSEVACLDIQFSDWSLCPSSCKTRPLSKRFRFYTFCFCTIIIIIF